MSELRPALDRRRPHRRGRRTRTGRRVPTRPPARWPRQVVAGRAKPMWTPRWPSAVKAVASTGRTRSLSARTRVLFAFRELVARAPRRTGRADHRRARQGARRTPPARCSAASRSSSSPAASRTCSRASTPTRSRRGVDAYSLRQPLGVVAGITPFNFPVMVPMWMFPIAIACGNTFVLKPSEQDPSASRLARRAVRRGRAARRACSTSSRGTPTPSTRCSTTPTSPAVSFVGLDADRPLRLRNAARPRASACRPSAARRTTWSCCPTPTSTGAADAAVSAGYGSRGRAVHGDLGRRGGRRPRPTSWSSRDRVRGPAS